MADAKTETAPKFDLHPYVPGDKPGHYDDHVQALIEADKDKTPEQIKSGDVTAITIQIPANKDPEKFDKEIAKHKRWFQESAKRYGRTSRLVDSSDQEDGSVHLDFILREQIKRTRKPRPEAAPDSVEDSDTPVSDAA